MTKKYFMSYITEFNVLVKIMLQAKLLMLT